MFNAFTYIASRRKRFSGVLTLCLTLAGSAVHAQPILTLDQALRLAQDRSRQLVAQDYAAASAREMAIAAGQLPDPTWRVSITCRSTARIASA